MARRFQPLLAPDPTMGLGSFPRDRASVVRSLNPRHTRNSSGRKRVGSPMACSQRLLLAGSYLQRKDITISKRLRNRFDTGKLNSVPGLLPLQGNPEVIGEVSLG